MIWETCQDKFYVVLEKISCFTYASIFNVQQSNFVKTKSAYLWDVEDKREKMIKFGSYTYSLHCAYFGFWKKKYVTQKSS